MMFIDILFSGLIGAIMGFTFHCVRNNRTMKKPKNQKDSYYLGVYFDIATGVFGAIFMIVVIAPVSLTDPSTFLLRTIIGAAAGESILANIELKKERIISEYLRETEDTINSKI